MYVHDIGQYVVTKIIPRKKKCKKAKCLSEEALYIPEKRRERQKQRERQRQRRKERYIHLNADFPRIAKINKKAFLSDQYKEIEENKRLGKTRDLFKKISDTKGALHAAMGTIKDRNGIDLTDGKILRKGAKNTHKNHIKMILMNQITLMV